MIDQTAQLHELPDYWQEQIRRLRSENVELRKRLRAIEALSEQELPARWVKKIQKIRKENARLRIERNEARAELEVLRSNG